MPRRAGSPPDSSRYHGFLNSAFVSGVIAGPRTEEQWDDYVRALDYRFTAEDEALIDRLVTSGHPSTPGFNDPPIRSRGGGRGRRGDLTTQATRRKRLTFFVMAGLRPGHPRLSCYS